ncbi:MAG: bifunctional proline dehydrogenase/L-glutamate gamma-semialdehyde dehydrogenase [Phycisphaera sp.]|nr:bifunctional proline dehydrogenase/L-glutamate gamma-semialdehyde dehydrogenase [Phycisphaera sp.]
MPLFFKSKASSGAEKPSSTVSPAPVAPASATEDPGVPIPPSDPALERRTIEIGEDFLDRARGGKSGMLSKAFWSDKLMDWSMKDEAFKVQLFRFVDAFPMLRTPTQVHDHLTDYLSQPGVTPPPGMDLAIKAGGVAKSIFAKTMSGQITGMGEKFIAGTDAADALPMLEKLWKRGLGFSVDLLGEACVSDVEADMYRRKYLDLIENLPEAVGRWPGNEKLERDHLGPIPRTNVSIKISSLYSRTDPIDTPGSIDGLVEALRPLLIRARDRGVFVNFDMEQHELKDLTLELFMRCCEEVDFTAGLAMQAYLRSGDQDASRIIEWSKRTGRQVTVRLVKGAYWDYETIHAEEMGWPVPVWSRKVDSDACFERMAAAFIHATPRTVDEGGVKLALGSHNARSIGAAIAELEKAGLPKPALELQMLYGMAPELKQAASDMGFRVREYVPVGEMIPGMAYLVRRLLENTSNESWLKAGFMDGAESSALLASPHKRFDRDPGVDRIEGAAERHELSTSDPEVGDGRPFFSESFRDFSERSTRDAFARAVDAAVVPTVANDATEADADRAMSTAQAAFPAWRDTPVRERSAVLVKAAAIMRRRRDELSGIIIRESGKPWREADGDVCEAIDFCEFYAREAVSLFEPRRLGRFIGEIDEVLHQPRGVAVVISPWNFPLAICTGMTAAALVCGNTCVVKPAEQTPGIARVMHEILIEAGCPAEACILLPGPGETVGARLVRDPRTSLIAFTGSKAVGLDILQAAGTTPEEQLHVKKVVCEMGGKNAVIVDASADLDEAVLGVRQSAFGFSGQKCSACSRAIVVETAYDTFLDRIVESTRSLVVGDPRLPGTDIGPVIDRDAQRKIREYIEIGRSEGRVEVELDVPDGLEESVGLPYVGPAVVSGIEPGHRLATEEVFGPVLAVIKVRDFEEALAVANSTAYKLTGGVFSRKPSHLDLARRDYRVGNLYLNRGITGALVGRQPFGGFGMSGVGSKAGGHDYLLHFVEPRAITENAMRRGFAPGLE